MSYRSAGVTSAVLSLLACAGFAFADQGAAAPAAPKMSIGPSALTLDSVAADPLLQQALNKVGVDGPLKKAGISVYGWVEAGYTYNNRNNQFQNSSYSGPRVTPGVFNSERNTSPDIMLNQIALVVERTVDSSKASWDVGGRITTQYGSDSAVTRANGMQIYAGQDQFSPTNQFDWPEAYVDVTVPVKGLTIRAGKFATLIGTESLNPTGNAFYSHSWIYASEPITQTGILGIYQLNDDWSFTAGVTRGWDQALEDNNGAVDFLGQVSHKFNKQWSLTTNISVGPQDTGDTGHYRVLLNPNVTYKATDKLTLQLEGLNVRDGNLAGAGYGDYYGTALYAGYALNDMFTLNGRGELIHYYAAGVNMDIYEVTLGVTITPMPKQDILKGLSIRPEVRYDNSTNNTAFVTGTNAWHDQLTFATDVIFKF
jgi:hypothetical protein